MSETTANGVEGGETKTVVKLSNCCKGAEMFEGEILRSESGKQDDGERLVQQGDLFPFSLTSTPFM